MGDFFKNYSLLTPVRKIYPKHISTLTLHFDALKTLLHFAHPFTCSFISRSAVIKVQNLNLYGGDGLNTYNSRKKIHGVRGPWTT